MMNYIKSECYRVSHTKGIYLTTGILTALVILLNVLDSLFGGIYATTSFSYSNLVGYPMMYGVMGVNTAYVLYEGSRKNGNLKNTVASGISRVKIFAGECIVATAAATVSMIVVICVWVVSAEMCLEKAGPVGLGDFLMEIPAMYLIAVACLISSMVFLDFFGNLIAAGIVWIALWFLIPTAFMLLGMRFDVIAGIAMWFPNNFLEVNALHVNLSECVTAWDSAEGLARCILSGAAGIAGFSLLGAMLLRRKDLV